MPRIERSYFLCATPRSGSNWLCEILCSLEVAGRPEEYFWNPPYWYARWQVAGFAAYWSRLLEEGTGPNGVFGSKLMREQVTPLVADLRGVLGISVEREPSVFASVLPDLRYIWLRRRDRVRQGISFYRAILRFLDLDPLLQLPLVEWQHQRQADALSDDWAARYMNLTPRVES